MIGMNRISVASLLLQIGDGHKFRLPTVEDLKEGMVIHMIHIPRNERQRARIMEIAKNATKIVIDAVNTWSGDGKVQYRVASAPKGKFLYQYPSLGSGKVGLVPKSEFLSTSRVPEESGPNLTTLYLVLKDEYQAGKRTVSYQGPSTMVDLIDEGLMADQFHEMDTMRNFADDFDYLSACGCDDLEDRSAPRRVIVQQDNQPAVTIPVHYRFV